MRPAKTIANELARDAAPAAGYSGVVVGLAYALALMVLALMVAGAALHLRSHLREHLVERDGEILTAVALARQFANGSGSNLTQRIKNPVDQLVLMLEISQLKEGVMGVRLFNRDGQFQTAVPPTMMAAELLPGDLAALQRLQPVSRYHSTARMEEFFLVEIMTNLPAAAPALLEVSIPLYARGDTNLLAVAQLVLDGRGLAQEYGRIDGHLWWLSLGLYLAGALLLTGVLGWAYLRLRRAHAMLAERTARLLRANHELSLAAKTTAVGSLTAHLIHGLSNPLANLQDFLASHSHSNANGDLQVLAASTLRMQQLVHEVVSVLSEERGGDRYQIAMAELGDLLKGRHRLLLADHQVNLVIEYDVQGILSNHHANLILLILENLVHNAIKVTPRGGKIWVQFNAETNGICCLVGDQGQGIPESVLPRLFTPCRSTQGGSGLGLAISKQLADQLGATLELQTNSPSGCVFALHLTCQILVESEEINTNQASP